MNKQEMKGSVPAMESGVINGEDTIDPELPDSEEIPRIDSIFIEQAIQAPLKMPKLGILKMQASAKSLHAGSSLFTGSSLIQSISSRAQKSFNFMKKRELYRVIVDGIDYTPDDLVDSDYVTMKEEFSHAAYDVKAIKSDVFLKETKSKSMRSQILAEGGVKVYSTTIDIDNIHIDQTLNTEEGNIVVARKLKRAPSAFYLPKMNPATSYPPEICIVLKETPTHYLFELPQLAFDKNSAEAAKIEADNDFYHFMTVGKGRNRKMVNEETQTIIAMTQVRTSVAPRPEKKNASSFASLWDMYDTYAAIDDAQEPEEEDDMVLYQCAPPQLLRKKKSKAHGEDTLVTFEDVAKSSRFLDSALIIQRVLASKDFSNQQKRFRGLVDTDPYSLDLVYIYTMRALWSLESEETTGRPITSISFNPKNENILAVAYGKFAFAEKRKGLVCLWNTKNPCKPERTYWFQEPLSAVAFSAETPNALALGFCNGDVLIIDITSYSVNIVARSKRETNPSYEPIWVMEWRVGDNKNQYVMTACQDGRISKFISTKTHDFICVQMMRISSSEGKCRGIDVTKECVKEDVLIDRHPAALCLKWQPYSGNIYLVGTEEGCIHRCSTNYLNQHVDVFRAHAGPVYYMEFSPFYDSLLLSCGADGAIRLWIDGIDVVIITLNCDAAVLGATFCPINSTVILSISGNILSVWDLRRKTHTPCAEHAFPQNVTLTYIKFSTSGDNVFVGDTQGCVHTFHLEDTPIPPFYQRKLLDETIKKALNTRPRLLKQLEKLEAFRRV